MRPHRRRAGRSLRGIALAGAGASLVLCLAMAGHAAWRAGVRFRWAVEPQEAAAGRPLPAPRAPRLPPASPAGSTMERGAAQALERPRTTVVPGRRIDFETYPGGARVCAPCLLSDEYAVWGVRFSFRSWTAASPRPHIVDARPFRPAERRVDHAVAAALTEERGLEVGVVRLELPNRPARLAFELTGPDLIPRFQVTAWTGRGRIESAAIRRSGARRYEAAGGGWFRRETVTIEDTAGIERVELDGWGPPGHVLLLDDLRIGGDLPFESGDSSIGPGDAVDSSLRGSSSSGSGSAGLAPALAHVSPAPRTGGHHVPVHAAPARAPAGLQHPLAGGDPGGDRGVHRLGGPPAGRGSTPREPQARGGGRQEAVEGGR